MTEIEIVLTSSIIINIAKLLHKIDNHSKREIYKTSDSNGNIH